MDTNNLLEKIKGKDDNARTEAWQSAGTIGAPAVKPLANLLTVQELEVARAAKRGLWKIVHTAGRPGAGKEKSAVVHELLPLLQAEATVQREDLWMLSQIGGDEAVEPMAKLLSDKAVREDARAALQRLPGKNAEAALQMALAEAPEDFKAALAEALRDRGVKVEGHPSQKLKATKQTTVKAEV